MSERVALIGGVYSNYVALEATVNDIARRGADAIYCLGDLGAFGPHPNRVFPILLDNHIRVVQGNYDNSVGNGLDDCQCGYTDPRDNYYAKLSYDYTLRNTSDDFRAWMKTLPPKITFELGGFRVLLCHGSPRKTNEFLWESTTPTHFLAKLCSDYKADIICATHTGIHWQRDIPGNRRFINVGVIGRPEHNGRTEVGYTMLEIKGNEIKSTYTPVVYGHQKLAAEMRDEHLPEEFIETILTGWWTTCLEILPEKERRRGPS